MTRTTMAAMTLGLAMVSSAWAQSTPAAKQARTALPAAAAPASNAAATVPAQTPIQLQLETHLSTRDNQYGDGFAARVMTSVYFQGKEVIPQGSIIEGHVMRVRDERPAVADSELLLKPDLLSTPDGRHYVISADVVQADPNSATQVDSEGVLREPRGMMHSDVRHTEVGGGAGVVGGALLAGGQGALMGAGVGAAVAAGIWLVRHRHLELNPGSVLTVRLDRPLQLVAR